MTDQPPHARRRRQRRRASSRPDAQAQSDPESVPEAASATPRPPRRRGHPRERDDTFGDLAGSGPSQLGVERALRARDVNRPSDDDLAAAEQDVVLVRRNWTPQGRS